MTRKQGISKAELAMLAGVIIVIVSITIPVIAAVRMQAKLSEARADILELLTAGERFFSEYRTWPSEHKGEFGDRRYGESVSNRQVMNALRAIDDAGNTRHSVNPRRIEFLAVEDRAPGQSGLDERGAYYDPWGNEYQVMIDTDFDNAVTLEGSVFGTIAEEGMAIWSYGPDMRPDTQDDICSWRL